MLFSSQICRSILTPAVIDSCLYPPVFVKTRMLSSCSLGSRSSEQNISIMPKNKKTTTLEDIRLLIRSRKVQHFGDLGRIIGDHFVRTAITSQGPFVRHRTSTCCESVLKTFKPLPLKL